MGAVQIAGCSTRRSKVCSGNPDRTQTSNNLEAIVRHYVAKHKQGHDEELTEFRNQPSLEAALLLASGAVDEAGYRFDHQRRITHKAIAQATRLLIESRNQIESCSSFHELWCLVTERLEPVYGIGELYIYDTSVRIGAFLRLKPQKV